MVRCHNTVLLIAGLLCLSTVIVQCLPKELPLCSSVQEDQCGDKSGPFKHCKCKDGFECKDQGGGDFKCQKELPLCAYVQEGRCGDKGGLFKHCKCKEGYECKDKGSGIYKCLKA